MPIVVLAVVACILAIALAFALRPRAARTAAVAPPKGVQTFWAPSSSVAIQPGCSISALLVRGVAPGRRFRNELFLHDGTVRVLDRVAGGEGADTVLRVDLGGPTTGIDGARVTVEDGAIAALGLECRF